MEQSCKPAETGQFRNGRMQLEMNELDIIHATMKVGAMFRRKRYIIAESLAAEGTEAHVVLGHGRILGMLAMMGETPQNELAEKMGIRPQSLTVAMTKMEERGDIIRRRNPDDKRQILVSLTEKGSASASVIEASRLETAKTLLDDVLDDSEKETLYTLLMKIIDKQLEEEAKEGKD